MTLLGGSSDDFANGIALDSSNNAYVTGQTKSSNFPTTSGALQTALNGTSDAFVAKITPTSGTVSYSTLFDGSGDDWGNGLAVDAAGAVYIAGETTSSDLP